MLGMQQLGFDMLDGVAGVFEGAGEGASTAEGAEGAVLGHILRMPRINFIYDVFCVSWVGTAFFSRYCIPVEVLYRNRLRLTRSLTFEARPVIFD